MVFPLEVYNISAYTVYVIMSFHFDGSHIKVKSVTSWLGTIARSVGAFKIDRRSSI